MFQISNVLVLVVLDFVLPLGMPRYNGSDLQPSSEEVTLSEIARIVLMGVKEKAILATAKALNGEDIPTPKKRGRPSKGGKQLLQQRRINHKRQQRRQ